VFKRIFICIIFPLVAGCGSSDKGEVQNDYNFQYEGLWGRAFLVYDDQSIAKCVKEVVSIVESKWELYQLVYLDDVCETLLGQFDFEGNIVGVEETSSVNGLPIKKLTIEDVDWVAMGVLEPFYVLPENPNAPSSDIIFAIAKGIHWDNFKPDGFEFNLFHDGSLYSNIFTANLLYQYPSLDIDGDSIKIDSPYTKIDSLTKEQVDTLLP